MTRLIFALVNSTHEYLKSLIDVLSLSLSLTHTAAQSHILKPEEVTNGDAIALQNTGQRSVSRTVEPNEGNKDTREGGGSWCQTR